MSEQFNVYRILLRYDKKSRYRKIKKQRRYERLIVTSQFLNFKIFSNRNNSYFKSSMNEFAFYRAFERRKRIFDRFRVDVETRSHDRIYSRRHFRNQMQCRRFCRFV